VHSRHLCFWHYQWRQLQFQVDELRGQFGKVNKEVAMKKKAKEDADELIAKAKEIDTQIKAKEVECDEVAKKRDELIKVMHEYDVQSLGIWLRGETSSFSSRDDACMHVHMACKSCKYAHMHIYVERICMHKFLCANTHTLTRAHSHTLIRTSCTFCDTEP
jgi:hypothetical protein